MSFIKNKVQLLLIVPVLMISLTSCETMTRISEIETGASCPTPKKYTQEQRNKVADELDALQEKNPKAVTPGFISDYQVLRAQVRACKQ